MADVDKQWLSSTSWYTYVEHFCAVSQEEFDTIWDLERDFIQNEVLMYGKYVKVPRKQGLYSPIPNTSYNFSGCTVHALPVPEVLEPFMAKFGDAYNAVFVNWYQDGKQYISAHADDENDLEPGSDIASISLGDTRTFRIRDKKNKKIVLDVDLKHGDLFIMGGDFQKEFTHEVPKRLRSHKRRINLTLRQFK